jgi:Flp pilus assembly protein protease CpaA
VNVVAVNEVAVPVAARAAAAFPFVLAVLAVVDVGVLLVPNWRAILLALLWFSLAVSYGFEIVQYGLG